MSEDTPPNEGQKTSPEDTKSQTEDTKSQTEDTKSQTEDNKQQVENESVTTAHEEHQSNKSERNKWDYVKDSLTIIIQIGSISLTLLMGVGFFIIWFYIKENSFGKPIIDISSTTFLFIAILFALFYFFFTIIMLFCFVWLIPILNFFVNKKELIHKILSNPSKKKIWISLFSLYFILLMLFFIIPYTRLNRSIYWLKIHFRLELILIIALFIFLSFIAIKSFSSSSKTEKQHYIMYGVSFFCFFLLCLIYFRVSEKTEYILLIYSVFDFLFVFVFAFLLFEKAGKERKNKPSFHEMFFLALIFIVVFNYLSIVILIFFGLEIQPVDYFMVEIGMRSTPDTLIYIKDKEYKTLSDKIFLLSAQINSRKISEPDGTVFWYLPQSLALWHDSTNYILSVHCKDKDGKQVIVNISVPVSSLTMIPSLPIDIKSFNPPGNTTKNLENQEKSEADTAKTGSDESMKTDESATLKNDSGIINNLSGTTSCKIDIFNNAVIHVNNTEIFENEPTPLKKTNKYHIYHRPSYKKYYPSHRNSASAPTKPNLPLRIAPDKGKPSC